MLTGPQLVTTIQNNLSDPRLDGIARHLQFMIERINPGVGVPPYRFKNTDTNTDITSLADLQAALDPAKIVFQFKPDYSSGAGSTAPVNLVFLNIEIEISEKYTSDAVVSDFYGTGKFNLGMTLAYLNDNDTVLPLKISQIYLVSK